MYFNLYLNNYNYFLKYSNNCLKNKLRLFIVK